jgi:hypothetical protein
MKYSKADLHVVDSREWVRKNRARLFPDGVVGSELADRVRVEAESLGSIRAAVLQHGEWYIVGAELDWLAAGRFQVGAVETFRRVVALPEAGQTSIRMEILVAEFARDVVTASSDGVVLIAGSCDIVEHLEVEMAAKAWVRLVAFRL